MAKEMVFRHVSSLYESPASDRIVRNGVVTFVCEDGVTERRAMHNHEDLHTNKDFKFKELRNLTRRGKVVLS